MSRQPRFEEIDDDSDPGELDLPEYGGSSALLSPNDLPQASTGGMPKSADSSFKPHIISQQDLEHFKNWSCIYPVYFDASRSLQEGRRVPLKLAVKNPMAKELAEATASLGVQSVFEVLFTTCPRCQLILCSPTKLTQTTGQIQVGYE
jgi:signal recognition particle subunit SRP19